MHSVWIDVPNLKKKPDRRPIRAADVAGAGTLVGVMVLACPSPSADETLAVFAGALVLRVVHFAVWVLCR
jgi:hypothetical protein